MRLKPGKFVRVALLTVAMGGCLGLVASTVLVRSEKGRAVLRTTIGDALGAQRDASGHRAGYQVRIGSMDAPGLSRVELRDVAVTTGSGAPLLSVPRMVVSYRPLRLLHRGGHPASAITGMQVIDPRLDLVRDSNGRWNIASLLDGPRGDGPGFLAWADARLKVIHGTVTVSGLQGFDHGVGVVDGSVRANRGMLRISRASLTSGGSTAALKGSVRPDGTLALRGSLKTGSLESDLPELAAYLGWGRGDGRLSAVVSGTVSHPSAVLVLEASGATVHGLPVTLARIPARLDSRGLRIAKGTGTVMGQSVTVSGGSSHLDVSVPDADVAQLTQGTGLPLWGRVSATMSISRGQKGWTLAGIARSRSLAYAGLEVDYARARFSYRDGRLGLTDGSLRRGDARGAFEGVVEGRSRTSLGFSVQDMQLADLALADSRLDVSGIGDVKGTLSFKGGRFETAGTLEVRQPSYRSIGGDSLYARYDSRDGSISLSDVALGRGAATYTGHARVSGLATGGLSPAISGVFQVKGESVSEFASMAGASSLGLLIPGRGGAVDGSVTVNGPMADPTIEVAVALAGRSPSTSVDLRLRDGRLRVTRIGRIGLG